MKKFMVGIGLAMALAGTAAAQHPGHEGGARREQGERRGRGGPDGLLLKDIQLTEGQRAQIAQLRKTQRDAMVKRDTTVTREERRAQHIAAVRNLLTAEQRVQFDKNVTELKAREAHRAQKVGQRGERGGRGRGKPGR